MLVVYSQKHIPMHKKHPNYLKSNMARLAVMLIALLLLPPKKLLAETVTDSSIADLQKAIDKAKACD